MSMKAEIILKSFYFTCNHNVEWYAKKPVSSWGYSVVILCIYENQTIFRV